MRFFRIAAALAGLAACSGCGYVHFGRLPERATPLSDPTGAAYTNLLTEQKILKQELALARKEGNALRTALEHGGVRTQPELAAQLAQATRELATLRASHAKLQTGGGSAAQLSDLEEKLNASLRNYVQLQEENARLRTDLEKARAENVQLTGQLKAASTENVAAQGTISQLNSELIAQKEARARAEQATAAVKAQLGAVMARRELVDSAARDAAPAPITPTAPTASTMPTSNANAGTASTPTVSALALAKAPPADSSAVAELRTNPERVRNAESAAPSKSAASAPTSSGAPVAPAAPPKRTHVVQSGDTLEKIATKYYSDPKQWVKIYTANSAKLREGGGAITPGMELEVPER